jgi:putative ABC transport system ATP-binding protein
VGTARHAKIGNEAGLIARFLRRMKLFALLAKKRYNLINDTKEGENMSLIEVRNLNRVYGKGESRFEALKNINFSIEQGESVAIIGKSGSGKSTLMHLLALLDHPTSGEILLNGENTAKMKKKELNKTRNKVFGFVFQQFFMNAKESVLNNVTLPLKIAGVKKKTRKAQAMKALEQVEIDSKARNRATDLSGGQKQRVCIARALVNDPQIIFADEPTGNLDSKTGEKVEDILFGLNKNQGITLIVVTHDDELAAKCDRQIKIVDGEIVEGGE